MNNIEKIRKMSVDEFAKIKEEAIKEAELRDKQIEEMARTICPHICGHYGCESCDLYDNECCLPFNIAIALTERGYRKASEVAREIFEEIARYLRLNEDIAIKCKEENDEWNEKYWKGKLSAFKQIRGFIDVELKKKYTESEKDK